MLSISVSLVLTKMSYTGSETNTVSESWSALPPSLPDHPHLHHVSYHFHHQSASKEKQTWSLDIALEIVKTIFIVESLYVGHLLLWILSFLNFTFDQKSSSGPSMCQITVAVSLNRFPVKMKLSFILILLLVLYFYNRVEQQVLRGISCLCHPRIKTYQLIWTQFAPLRVDISVMFVIKIMFVL